ncbi:MAG: class I SAM-dependent methyltransferase [Candidatus Omnitrophica bacterium]|nr:class I SAM-dependent methyltransferase [Candidatus Omnitrophota bacterium]
MKQKPELLYLDLMKKTLSFTLWPEPPMPIIIFNSGRPAVIRFVVSVVSKVLDLIKLQIVKKQDFLESRRIVGGIWPRYADTMIGLKRLDNLQYCIETVLSEKIKGDFIETGVWRGGACIFMRAVLAAYAIEDRKIFVADSFEGLPKPDADKYPADKSDKNYINTYLAVSKEDVENNFRKYGLLDNQVVFLKGWFKDTLPQAPIEKLSILRLDGDMYGSTMESLENLYPKLSSGGFCIIDDYALPGCESAVNDFRAKYMINAEMKEIDWTGRYWKKE